MTRCPFRSHCASSPPELFLQNGNHHSPTIRTQWRTPRTLPDTVSPSPNTPTPTQHPLQTRLSKTGLPTRTRTDPTPNRILRIPITTSPNTIPLESSQQILMMLTLSHGVFDRGSFPFLRIFLCPLLHSFLLFRLLAFRASECEGSRQ